MPRTARATPHPPKRATGRPARQPAKAASVTPPPQPAAPPPASRPSRRPEPIDPEKYPNLSAHRDLERAIRIHRAMQAGMSREQAIAHADEHLLPVRGRRTSQAGKASPASSTRVARRK